MTQHLQHMTRALKLAERGRYHVSPNPMVGCVIVKQDQIISQGWHTHYGGDHAEIMALKAMPSHLKDATMYLTLEPCVHHGKTPPCIDQIIAANFHKVYIACLDQNPKVKGKGVEQLKESGVQVHVGLCEGSACKLNETFFHYMKTKRPFVIAKWAMSLDGQMQTHPTDSRIISNQSTQQLTHRLRHQVDAILIGRKTANIDNPKLTVRDRRISAKEQPLRIVLDTQGSLPTNLAIFTDKHPEKTWVITTTRTKESWRNKLISQGITVIINPVDSDDYFDLPALLYQLGQQQISSLLIEGGRFTHQAFLQANLINKVHTFIAPTIINPFNTKQPLYDTQLHQAGDNAYFEGYLHQNT